MNRMAKATCLLAAIAVAGTSAAALAGKRMTPQERQARAEQVRQNHRQFEQPQTLAQAEATAVRQPDGTVGLAVPVELWNHLSVTRDASGKVQVHETEGDAIPATARTGGNGHDK